MLEEIDDPILQPRRCIFFIVCTYTLKAAELTASSRSGPSMPQQEARFNDYCLDAPDSRGPLQRRCSLRRCLGNLWHRGGQSRFLPFWAYFTYRATRVHHFFRASNQTGREKTLESPSRKLADLPSHRHPPLPPLPPLGPLLPPYPPPLPPPRPLPPPPLPLAPPS